MEQEPWKVPEFEIDEDEDWPVELAGPEYFMLLQLLEEEDTEEL